MSVRLRCGVASRCMICDSVASRYGERRRCGCEEPPFDTSQLRKDNLIRRCALVSAEVCESGRRLCSATCEPLFLCR